MAIATTNGNPTDNPTLSVQVPIAATTHIYQYRYVALNSSGYLVPVQDAASLTFIGRSTQEVNNTGSAGAASVNVVPVNAIGCATFPVNGANATQAWVGSHVFFANDFDVYQAGSATNKYCAGRVVRFINASTVVVDMTDRCTPATS